MEPESNVHQVQPAPWKQILAPVRPPRLGQIGLWVAVGLGLVPSHLAVLPTGYGKTIAAIGAYAIARGMGRVNRLLVLVPTIEQRRQWTSGAAENFAGLGVQITSALSISKTDTDLRYASSGKAEVFVATYQQAIEDPRFWERLTSTGKWFVVYDECHHLRDGSAWGIRANAITRTEDLYLSATIIRTDREPLAGVPSRPVGNGEFELVPTIIVSIEDALREEAIRPLRVHVHHYFVDVELNGNHQRVTTEVLQQSGCVSFSDYEAKYQLRYLQKYLSTILLDAVKELDAKNLRQPDEHQMLVFAMTCRHAASVCRALNDLVGESLFADWVGSGPNGRSDEENAAVMDRFKAGRLRCLVQVDKAGEGFDNVRCSVLVFLHLVRSDTKGVQQIGRGVRRNYRLAFASDYCSVFASADAPILPHLVEFESKSELVCKEKACGDENDERDGAEPTIVGIPELLVVNSELDRVELVGKAAPPHRGDAASAADLLRECGFAGVDAMSEAALLKLWDRVHASRAAPTPAASGFASETERLNYYRDKCLQATRALAGNALRAKTNGQIERSALGDIMKSINGEWVRRSGRAHSAMTADDFIAKYEWVRQTNVALKAGTIPHWMSL